LSDGILIIELYYTKMNCIIRKDEMIINKIKRAELSLKD